MRVGGLAVFAAVLLPVLAATPAAAGGGSILDFPRDWAPVGQTVTGSGVFGSGLQARVREGPWFAYLQPSDDDGRRIYLGPVSISAARGNLCCWRASVTFIVPPVAPGYYWVRVCDRGCTTGVGDLSGGVLYVAATEQAGIAREARQAVRYRARQAERRSARELAGVEAEAQALRARWSRAAYENEALQAELAGLEADLRHERDRVPVGAWLLIGAAAGATSAGVVGARRRRRPPRSATERPVLAPMDAGKLVGSGRR